MKNIITLLFLFVLINNTACNKEELSQDNIISVEGSSFQLMEIADLGLLDGVYNAEINDVLMKVISQKGIVKWIMPEINEGKYIMSIEKGDANYRMNVLVKENVVIEDPNAYLLRFIDDANIGLTAKQISEMTHESRVKYAKFLEVNREEVLKKVSRNVQEKSSSISTTPLAINQSVSFNVSSENKWNTSGVCVTAGEVYQISATGIWTDWFIDTDADGYSKWYMDLFGFLKRAPNHNWFKLIGSIDRQRNYPIGISEQITATESGNLEFYANDILFFYWNNIGGVVVTITRIS